MTDQTKRRFSVLDKILVICIMGTLVGGVIGTISAYTTALPVQAGASDDPGDPFVPPPELIQLQPTTPTDPGVVEEPRYQRRYDLSFIDAKTALSLIGSMGIDVNNATVGLNPRTLWVRGTSQNLSYVDQLIRAVDRPENEISLSYRMLATQHIHPARMVELLGDLDIAPERYVIINRNLYVFDRELVRRWQHVLGVAGIFDTPEARDRMVFVHRLSNSSAQDVAERLSTVGYDDVDTQLFNYPQFSKELVVITPPHLQDEVRETLATLDSMRRRIRVPIANLSGENARRRADALVSLLSQLSGVPTSSMHVSENLSGNINVPRHVLWVEESPDVIRHLEDLVSKILSSPSF